MGCNRYVSPRIANLRSLWLHSAGLVALVVGGGVSIADVASAQEQTVTIVSWGGTTQDAIRKSVWDPIAKELGIVIKEDTLSANADIRARVQAANVTWDIVDVGSGGCVDLAQQGVLEPLDYSVINTAGTDPSLVNEYWVGWYYFSTVMAWNKEATKGAQPEGWSDFWDTTKFPGRRSLANDTANNLEFALMADGVPPDQLYPLDVDRAFRKLAEIQPDLKVWWQSGAQSVQLVQGGEADFISLWNARAVAAQKDAEVSFTFNQGMLDFECLVVPKGAPNRDLAYKVIDKIISADREAAFALALPYGPANQDAFDNGRISADYASSLPSAPENKKLQGVVDPAWWLDNQADVTERFQLFIQQ